MEGTSERLKVLYVAGWVRSGSTFLAHLLGELDGVFAGGELAYAWKRGFENDNPCGCGASFRACPFWSAAVREAFGGHSEVDAALLERVHARLLPARTLLSPLFRRRVADADLTAYRHAVERLYHAAARTAGARVLVDTSKTPTHLDVLTSIPSLDVTILHLVRDPRAIAYSQRHGLARWALRRARRSTPPGTRSRSCAVGAAQATSGSGTRTSAPTRAPPCARSSTGSASRATCPASPASASCCSGRATCFRATKTGSAQAGSPSPRMTSGSGPCRGARQPWSSLSPGR